MAYQIEWIEEPWLMRVNYVGKFSLVEFDAVLERCLEAVDKHPAYFLIDVSKVDKYVPDVLKSNLMMKFFRHPNTKVFAMTGVEGALMKFGLAVAGRFIAFKNFHDAETAIEHLRGYVDHHKQEFAQEKALSD
jgi:hypothetical protein